MKKKIAIFHPYFGWGGGECVCIWTIEALKKDYDLTLISSGSINLEALNNFFGTSLSPHEFKFKKIPLLLPRRKFAMLRQHLLVRCSKLLRKRYNLLVGTYNEVDFGRRGIQYIHFPALSGSIVSSLGELPENWLYKMYYENTFFRKFCRNLDYLISGYSADRMKKNRTLVNSKWTGEIVRKLYGIESTVIYPPVSSNFPEMVWEKKENGFLYVGGIFPQKRIERIIDILEEAKKVYDVHLHIIGHLYSKSYFKKIKKLIDKNSNWIFWHPDLSHDELKKYMISHKYGISGRENEHFGITVAEMVKAGCLVFVPNGGGQVEIVNNNQLIYVNKEEAVKKIITVLGNSHLQSSLLQNLALHSQRFSTENFIQNIRKVVEEFLRKNDRRYDTTTL